MQGLLWAEAFESQSPHVLGEGGSCCLSHIVLELPGLPRVGGQGHRAVTIPTQAGGPRHCMCCPEMLPPTALPAWSCCWEGLCWQ